MGQRLYEGMSLREISDFLFVSDEPGPSDLILVIGGKRSERAVKAAGLYNKGLAPKVLFTGGDKFGVGLSEAEALARRARELGVPEEDILVETHSSGTLENILMAVQMAEETIGWRNMKAVIVVSAPMHMKRVKQALARHIPREVKIYCCPDDRVDATKENWWQCGDWRDMVFRELEKVRAYSVQGEM